MGFCYPGKGKSGDKPPRKECAPTWHGQLFELMPNVELVLLIGMYAQNYYLKDKSNSLILYKHCVSFSLFKGRKFWTRSPRDFWATTIIAIHRFLRHTNLTLHAAWQAGGPAGRQARARLLIRARVQAGRRAATQHAQKSK